MKKMARIIDQLYRALQEQDQKLQELKGKSSWYATGDRNPQQATSEFPPEGKRGNPLLEGDTGSEHPSGMWQAQNQARKMNPSVHPRGTTTHASFPTSREDTPPPRTVPPTLPRATTSKSCPLAALGIVLLLITVGVIVPTPGGELGTTLRNNHATTEGHHQALLTRVRRPRRPGRKKGTPRAFKCDQKTPFGS